MTQSLYCFSRTRGRITAIRGGRGGVILSSSRPAPYVPEELISQAQSFLQVSLTQDPDPEPRIRSAPYVPEELIGQAQSVLQVSLNQDPDPRIRSGPYVPEELISQAQSVLQVSSNVFGPSGSGLVIICTQ